MVRKKRGSSLVTVVIISGILITVGTAMLSMTLGDYKMRITESTRIKNLYSSDSGLDVAYNILVKTFDAAAQYGVGEVDTYKRTSDIIDIDDEIKVIKEEDSKNKEERIKQLEAEKDKMIDEYFKKKFNTFIYRNPDGENVGDSETEPTDELIKSIKGIKYVSDISKTNEDERYTNVDFNSDKAPELFIDEESEGDNEGISYEPKNKENDNEYDTGEYTIKIASKFQTEDSNGTVQRKLQSTYTLLVPDYKDVSFSESNPQIATNPKITNKVLVIGGDMNVIPTTKSNLDIEGNIFVWGNDNLIDNKVYDKYKGGINLKNSTVNFNGEVVTGKTFNIDSNVDSTITGNLYALNVYAGRINGDTADSAKLTVKQFNDDDKAKDYNKDILESGQVVTDNDLTLKANNSKVEIDNFYGINDKNTEYGNYINTSIDVGKERTSSSIIVNGNKDSIIKINNKAYIMGVAHIATTPEYQTGESTGIKGNYIAYANDIDDNEKSDYYDPLQLLDEDNVLIKSKHFVDYWNHKLGDINTGGICLPDNTYSIGAIVYKNSDGIQLRDSSYTLKNQNDMDISNVIPKKRLEYASKLYTMGETPINDMKMDIYDSLGSGIGNPVDGLMHFESDTLDDYRLDDQNLNNEKAIFNDNSNATITISGVNNLPDTNKDIVKDSDGNICIYTKDGNVKAFIATTGTVIIDGKVNFDGNIMAEKDLIIKGDGNKEITYDKDLCDRIQASNVDIFNSVFGNSNIKPNPAAPSDSSKLSVDYDLKKFIKSGIWKIIK